MTHSLAMMILVSKEFFHTSQPIAGQLIYLETGRIL